MRLNEGGYVDRYVQRERAVEAVQWHEYDEVGGIVHVVKDATGEPYRAEIFTRNGPEEILDGDWLVYDLECRVHVFRDGDFQKLFSLWRPTRWTAWTKATILSFRPERGAEVSFSHIPTPIVPHFEKYRQPDGTFRLRIQEWTFPTDMKSKLAPGFEAWLRVDFGAVERGVAPENLPMYEFSLHEPRAIYLRSSGCVATDTDQPVRLWTVEDADSLFAEPPRRRRFIAGRGWPLTQGEGPTDVDSEEARLERRLRSAIARIRLTESTLDAVRADKNVRLARLENILARKNRTIERLRRRFREIQGHL